VDRVHLSIGRTGEPSSARDSKSLRTAADAARVAAGARYRGLYIHVPFCAHKCHYCDFYSFVDTESRAEAYVARLEAEMSAATEFVTADLETVFVGGGTPTLLRAELLQRMLVTLRSRLPLRSDAEFTVEANPETVTEAVARALVASGVTRVSLGAQSFDPALLTTLERRHDPASVARAVGTLQDAGIGSINLDLIYGIPNGTLEQWERDLARTIALNPDHISAYGLVYEPNTPLTARLRTGKIVRVAEEVEAAQCAYACQRLADAGYARYEISNWAKPGQQCRHNLLYWQNADWWALGPSGSAHASGVRWKNVPRLTDWLEAGPFSPVVDVEVLDDDTRAGEAFMLGLRLVDGLAVAIVEELIAIGARGEARRRAISAFERDGLLIRSNERLRLSERGLMIADTVLCELV
jgi:oxygen-independent coproporphyrinogen-3 oxidase